MLTPDQHRALEHLVTTLDANNIEFQATGGLAAIIHGATRPLYDIDIDIYRKDAEKVAELFSKSITQGWTHGTDDADDLFDLSLLTFSLDGVSVDISQMEGGRVRNPDGEWFSLPEQMDPEIREIEGIRLPVQKKDRLIAYKRLLARDTDLIDIEQMG